MQPNRDEAGNYAESVTPADVLTVFESVDGPIVTSADVAEAFDCSRETARRKLRTLEAQDRVASRKTAGRVLWWRTVPEAPPARIDPDDPFWELEPGASGRSDVSENVDEILYGDA